MKSIIQFHYPSLKIGSIKKLLIHDEGGRGGFKMGTHVNPWLNYVNVWQKPLQYCKVISLQLIKINGKKILKKDKRRNFSHDIYKI